MAENLSFPKLNETEKQSFCFPQQKKEKGKLAFFGKIIGGLVTVGGLAFFWFPRSLATGSHPTPPTGQAQEQMQMDNDRIGDQTPGFWNTHQPQTYAELIDCLAEGPRDKTTKAEDIVWLNQRRPLSDQLYPIYLSGSTQPIVVNSGNESRVRKTWTLTLQPRRDQSP